MLTTAGTYTIGVFRISLVEPLMAQRAVLRQKYFWSTVFQLFGSWARGEQTATSDIDILVEVDPSIGLRFVTLADQLEVMLGHKVDLVSHRAIRAQMWDAIAPDIIDV